MLSTWHYPEAIPARVFGSKITMAEQLKEEREACAEAQYSKHRRLGQTVLHLPNWLANPYLSLLARGIGNSGWNVVFAEYPKTNWPLTQSVSQHPEVSALHIHWTEPLFSELIWSRGTARFLFKSARFCIDAARVRLGGKNLVWTVHNQIAHESINPKREFLLNRILSGFSSTVIFHSDAARTEFEKQLGFSIQKKAKVIPHGNYIGWYESCEIKERRLLQAYSLKKDNIVLLVFGAVRRYKGIPRIVKSFLQTQNSQLRLIIAGRPNDDDLKAEIEQLAARDHRIILQLDFVDDKDVAPLLSISDVMVFGFERTLTSGSALLGMSFGLPLLLPELAKVLEVADETGAWYFGDCAELTAILDSLNSVDLEIKGKRNKQIAESLSWNRIGRDVARCYERSKKLHTKTR